MALLLACACVTAPKPKPIESPVLLQLAPSSLGHELSLVQRLTLTRGAVKQTFDTQLECDATTLRIAALVAGQTAASLDWNGTELVERRAPQVPSFINGARIVSDVQLVFWPEAAIRAGLPAGFSLLISGGAREVSNQGSVVARVTFVDERRARLENLVDGYVLDIDSLAQ